MQEGGVVGKLGRAILTSHLHFLLHVDEDWSLENLLPLFDVGHEDFRPAWDGFLTRGRITPQVEDRMRGGIPERCATCQTRTGLEYATSVFASLHGDACLVCQRPCRRVVYQDF